MLSRSRKIFSRGERGITGLETAIILIAFVVVAAVFAYTALSAGLFSTQEAQKAVYSGLETAQSTLEMKGGLVGLAEAEGAGEVGYLKQITFTVALAAGGQSIDFAPPTGAGGVATSTTHKVVISYIDEDQRVNDLVWTVKPLADANGNDLLEPGEKFQITIGGESGNDLVDALDPNLSCDRQFTIEVKPPKGAVLVMSRITPPYITSVINLN